MTAALREYDVAGRFGGEEFVMLLPQTRAPDAFKIADRVRARIGRMPIVTSSGGEKVTVTVSIGVAALDAGSSRRADRPARRGRRRALPGQSLRPRPGADDQHQPGPERGALAGRQRRAHVRDRGRPLAPGRGPPRGRSWRPASSTPASSTPAGSTPVTPTTAGTAARDHLRRGRLTPAVPQVLHARLSVEALSQWSLLSSL